MRVVRTLKVLQHRANRQGVNVTADEREDGEKEMIIETAVALRQGSAKATGNEII